MIECRTIVTSNEDDESACDAVIVPVSEGWPPPCGWKTVDSAMTACVGSGLILPGLIKPRSGSGKSSKACKDSRFVLCERKAPS